MNIDTLLDQLEAESAGMSKEAAVVTDTKTGAGAELEKTLTKEASAEEKGRQAAVGLLNKIAQVAQETPTKEEDDMSKQAETLADKIAEKLMEKFADVPTEGDANPYSNIVPGVAVEHKINEDNRAMLAQHNERVKPTPGTDGTYGGGTVNNILDAIIDDSLSMGAGTYDQMAANKANKSVNISGDEATDPAIRDNHGAQFKTNQVIKEAEESIEKAAAVNALIEAGIDFDTATDLVKQAAEEIEAEEYSQLKAAAVDELMEKGASFEEAVEEVQYIEKEAKKAVQVKNLKGTARMKAKAEAEAGSAVNKLKGAAGKVGEFAAKHKKGLAIGAAGAAAAGGAAYAYKKKHEKKAALETLVENGVDFDTAIELVKQASIEVYGEE